jgi:CubicO group peptidase (beta-lactamase class C family)
MQQITLTSAAQAELDTLLHTAVEDGELPFVAAMVANHDAVLYQGSFGAPPNAIYRLASLTKPITSVAILMLRERGLLNLDDLLERYLPQYAERQVIADFNTADGSYTTRAANNPITIRHLLTHSSGFGYDFTDEIVQGLCKDGRTETELPLLFDPGSRWLYSCATRILGDVITKVTGAPFYEFFDKEIFGPLGMAETSYFIAPENLSRLLPLTFREEQGWFKDPNPRPHRPFVSGEGGLLGTAHDYILFLQMLLNEGKAGSSRLLTEESFREMISNQIGEMTVQTMPAIQPRDARAFPSGGGVDKFGLGFQLKVGNENNVRSAGSYSWLGIFNTHFWVDPQKGIAALLFTQLLPLCDEQVMRLLADFEHSVYKNLA